MIPENVLVSYGKVTKTPVLQSRSLHRSEWEVLFEFYNANLSMGQRPLGMSCMSCFGKVLSFVKSQIDAIGVN